jgi:hypothetical protein
MDAQVLPSLHAELETLQTVRDLLQERLSLTFLTSGGKSLTSFEQAEPGNWIVSIQTTQMHSLTFLFSSSSLSAWHTAAWHTTASRTTPRPTPGLNAMFRSLVEGTNQGIHMPLKIDMHSDDT